METGYRRPVAMPKARTRSWVLELFCGLLIILVLAAILWPVSGGGGGYSRTTQAISHAKQAGLALVMYEGDYDDLIPYVESSKQLIAVTFPYHKDNSVWETLNEDRPGVFQLSMSLPGAKTTEIPNPADVPAIYDQYGRTPKSLPNDEPKFIVGFVDSHAKAMLRTKWNDTSKLLTLSLKRYGKPLR